jgi:hypothetical protein
MMRSGGLINGGDECHELRWGIVVGSCFVLCWWKQVTNYGGWLFCLVLFFLSLCFWLCVCVCLCDFVFVFFIYILIF